MKALVLDASTLILLAKIDLLQLVSRQIALVIPEAVNDEATRKREFADAKLILRLIGEKWLRIEKTADEKFVRTLEQDFQLGRGEAQAVGLAKAKGLGLGVDDGLAIKACKVLGVSFVTALAFLVHSYQKGWIGQKQAGAKLNQLKQYGWYHLSLLDQAADDIKGGGPS
jgi:predicted nucleic acid-binding protein